MNPYLALAAILSAVGGVLHSILGERVILSKIQPGALPETLGSSEFTHRVIRLFWHLVSVSWWGLAALLLLLAQMPASYGSHQLAWVIALIFLASSLVSLAFSRGKHFSWGVLLFIAAVIRLGIA